MKTNSGFFRWFIRVALFGLTLHVLSLVAQAQTWSAQTSGTANNLFGIHFTSAMEGWAVGASNTLRRTTDGGMTWTGVSPPGGVPAESYVGVFLNDASTVWVNGITTTMRTTNGGSTWNALVQIGSSKGAIFATSTTQAWVAGINLRRFTAAGDGSISETAFLPTSGFLFNDISFVDADNGWAVAAGGMVNPGQIRRISNGSGSPSITSQTSGTPNNTALNGIFMLDLNSGWIVGSSGTILKTTNGGTNWNPQTSGITTELRSVHFKDANEGWAVGASGVILHTTNGGTSWAQEGIGVTTQLLRRVFSINPVYAAGLSGTILKRDEPTAAKLLSFNAIEMSDGQISVEWQTGFEAENLGFNLYREQNGERVRLTRQLIAGSALLAGNRTALTAGRTYALRHKASGREARYWLETIGLNGQSVWHGPFEVKESGVESRESGYQQTAKTLTQLGAHQSDSTRVVERIADRSRARKEHITFTSHNLASGVWSPDAKLQALKISVRHEGWYRITQAELAAVGFDVKSNPHTLQLFVDGRELPILVSTNKNGRFDHSSFIEFYGLGIDTPSTDSHTYWLTQGKQKGKRVSQSKGEGVSTSSTGFAYSVERRDRNIYFAALKNGERENFFGEVVGRDGIVLSLPVRFPDKASEAATLEVSLQGVTLTPHLVSVFLNDSFLGEMAFTGQEQGAVRLPFAQSMLLEGANRVRLISTQGDSDISLVDFLRLTYQHRYISDADKLHFTAKSNERLTIEGFSDKTIRVFDVTNADEPQELISAVSGNRNGYAVTFATTGEGERRLLAYADAGLQHPAKMALNRPSNWRTTEEAADFVIITHSELLASFERLRALRESQGLSVALVDIEDIYDEFNYGEKSPQAVREFLHFARNNWQRAPRFVLLAGPASFDAKDYLQRGNNDTVPTKLLDTEFLETASDDWFADFDADGVAEMAVGRLPAGNRQEADAVITKIIAYEQAAPAQEALLVADTNDGFPFEAASELLRKTLPDTLRVTQINRGQSDPETAKRNFMEALNRDQLLVNYIGHGSTNLWRGNLLTASEARSLQNERLSLFVMLTCLNGYFHDTANESLAAALVKNERGGAVAVWASSGMTSPSVQAAMSRTLFTALIEAKTATLGELIQKAKASIKDVDVRRTWVLFGDPTIRVK